MKLEAHGQIKHLELPSGWIRCDSELKDDAIYFCAPDDPTIKLTFIRRNFLIDTFSAQNLKEILDKTPHTATSLERENLELVLLNAADPEHFELSTLRSEFLNQRPVLRLEGSWKRSNIQCLAFYFACAEKPRRLEEIFFEASPAGFASSLPEVQKSLASIIWV